MSFSVVIPARFASSRLPGKPLLDIAGKRLEANLAGMTTLKLTQLPHPQAVVSPPLPTLREYHPE